MSSLYSLFFASGVEAFYRSAMNAKINQSISGKKFNLFPNMRVQIPTRIIYITGLKKVGDIVKPYNNKFICIVPGLFMTPFSSLLEASNVSKTSKEILKRFRNGITARCGREIIFAIGLNELSENLQIRYKSTFNINDEYICKGLGSLSSGIISGYASHHAHILSTMKLLKPELSYKQHWLNNVGSNWRNILFPKGLIGRTVQIMGSYIILNTIIFSWDNAFS